MIFSKRHGIVLFFFSFTISFHIKSAEGDLYKFLWLDADKKIYVLQNKIYKKKGTHYFDAGYIKDFSSNYLETTGWQFNYGYYFNETWAFELLYHMYSWEENQDTKDLAQFGKGRVIPFIRRFDSKMGAMILWAPFYGKINTFNKIIYFDWFFGLGGGLLGGQDNAKVIAVQRGEGVDKHKYESVSYPAVLTKTAFRIYIGTRFHTTLEYHFDMYQGRNIYKPKGVPETATETIEDGEIFISNGEVSLSFGVSF